ncbi:ArsR/SmtB family transcription factor [Bacillus cereus]|uniref:ArsR/SmtB family transcription factor n=1 Tax=Bacillus cereus TaxID=1396 RepID=UPI00277B4DAE|nr:ArsR family transcriptional regulator [Bacillus cereus]
MEIVRYLFRNQNKYTCGEIESALGMNKPNRSYHLKILLEADLILVERQGQFKFITVKEEMFQEFSPGFLATL